jgi:fructose-bisphosphate aldolase, class I
MNTSSLKEQQQRKIKWSNDKEMFALVHQMRARVITSPALTVTELWARSCSRAPWTGISEDSQPQIIWNLKRSVPFLKVDKGILEEKDGVQLLKPMPELAALLDKANANRIFGTKMRSFIKQANADGVKAIVSQQFEVAAQISAAGLVPIVEPEVDIHCPEKAKAEALLKAGILEKLNTLPAGQLVMLKVTLPEEDNFYADCIKHPNVLKVVALSGGYSPKEANERLRRNHGLIASFSRALLDGLLLQQSDEEYDAVLDAAIQSIYEASNT